MDNKTLVLLVEDDSHLLEVASDYLREVGYEVSTAHSGHEALEKARKVQPDIIVSDIMMQNGNGLYLLENLKRHPSTHLIPFIFVTARGSRTDMRQGMALGADDYITKPFNMDELELAIRSQLEKIERRSKAAVAFDQQHLLSLPHELRTPLNGILGITDLMIDGLRRGRIPSPAELEENVGILQESGLRLFRLIENYLLYYELRLATGNPRRIELYLNQPAAVPLSPDFFANLCSHHKRANDVRINMTPATLPIGVELFHKMVTELVDNSLKFSDPHETVYITGYEERGEYVLTVIDNGLGMTPEQIASVGPFTQFDREALEQQGVGLGLCLVRLIAEVFDLRLHIESNPNKGTSVILHFPLEPKS
ncbi:MAG: hybrid sensor histidine kinase/response regulator [Puniceicoccales bacterium]